MTRCLRIIQTEAENATVGSGDQHVDGDDDDTGSEISLLLLNHKVIYAEGLFLHLYWPRGSVPVAAKIIAGRAQVGGRVS